MSVADDELSRIGSVLDDWDREDVARPGASQEDLPDTVREALALGEALQPIIGVTIKLGADVAPGAEVGSDAEWAAVMALARRDVLANRAAGIDHGLASDHLRLLDRIDALLGSWPDDDWDARARRRVQELVEARRRGRERGRRLRQSRKETVAQDGVPVAWLLRHPADQWLRQALPTIADSECRRLINAQIAKLALSYQQLCELDWTAAEQVADVICEMQVLDTSPGHWKEPIPAVVTASIKGRTSPDGQIAVRLVADPDGPFNSAILSVLAGERWLTCARELQDGTLLPLDGTRRRAVSSS
jgi:hypothetical protein